MSYEPQPGTIAYRAIAWLKLQPAGTEVTASMWAEGIGNCDGATLIPCIGAALNAGLIKRATRDGMQRPFWYSLGNGNPARPQVPDDEDTRDPLPTRRVAPEVKPRAGEVLPGLKVPKFSEVLKQHQELDAKHEAVLDAEVVVSAPPAPIEAAGRPMTLRECMQAEEKPAALRPFDAWLSGVSGELVLQGIEVDADGDAILAPEKVAAVRRVLLGLSS